ncbi:MAG: hypothetical protein AB7Q97_25995 [Gammaproteobacteria bacterium]
MTTSPIDTIRALIARTREDFSGYFRSGPLESRARLLVQWAADGDPRLDAARGEIDAMLPDTAQDGRWEASYALNTGGMILNLIDLRASGDERHCREAVTLFFDSVDFKVQRQLESAGVHDPSQSRIASHPLYVRERHWFDGLASGLAAPD